MSIDTYKAAVALAAVASGASIVNDISGLGYDPMLGGVVARTGAGLVLMHPRGRPRDMYREAGYGDVVAEVSAELQQALERADAAGAPRARVVLDPGIGFAKRAAESRAVLANLAGLARLGRPLLRPLSEVVPGRGTGAPASRRTGLWRPGREKLGNGKRPSFRTSSKTRRVPVVRFTLC